MKEAFRTDRFHGKNQNIIDEVNSIQQQYKKIGLTETSLRNLYYILFSMGLLTTKHPYTEAMDVISRAKYCGLVDWDFIVDESRYVYIPSTFRNIDDLIQTAIKSYQLDRNKGQKYYIEIATEKHTITPVLKAIFREYQIVYSVNKGFNSGTNIYEMSKRYLHSNLQEGKQNILFYLGDIDPSGLYMSNQDIPDRLNEFMGKYQSAIPKIIRLALTDKQIEKYSIPTVPVKPKDNRFKWWKQQGYGYDCWEIDAIPMNMLKNIVESAVKSYVDIDLYNAVVEQERMDLQNSIFKDYLDKSEEGN